MVRNGWAIAYRYYSIDFIEDEKLAEKDEIGLWQGKFQEPYFFRKKGRFIGRWRLFGRQKKSRIRPKNADLAYKYQSEGELIKALSHGPKLILINF